MSAKLHCLYGIMMESSTHRPTRRTRTYPYACSKLYDLRNYTQKTMWGPFKEDGSGDVDWERMEAIMIVLSHNLKIIGERQPGFASIKWNMAWAESVPYSYISKTGPRPENVTTPLDLKDPYNVTGTYMRIVSFLGMSDFIVARRCSLMFSRFYGTLRIQLRARTSARRRATWTTRYNRSHSSHHDGD